MKPRFLFVLFLSLGIQTLGADDFEAVKAAKVKRLIKSCADSMLAQKVPLEPQQQSQFNAAVEKMRPIAEPMCRCVSEKLIKTIETAKTKAEIDSALKNIKPERSVIAKCSEKFPLPERGSK